MLACFQGSVRYVLMFYEAGAVGDCPMRVHDVGTYWGLSPRGLQL